MTKKAAQVLVRGLDPAIVDALRTRARANGRSLEAELRVVLAKEVTSRVSEHAPSYEPRTRKTKKKPTIAWKPPVRFPQVKLIKIKGKPMSQTLIEERR